MTEPKTARLILRCTPQELDAWRRDADLDGRPLAQWVRHELAKATRRSDLERAGIKHPPP